MNDVQPVSEKEITNAGVRGVGATVGGLGLVILRGISTAFGGIAGLVVGGLSFIVGAASVKSASKTDRRGGAIAMVAGIVFALPGLAKLLKWVPVVGGSIVAFDHLANGLIGIGALGLIGYGVYNIVKFAKGLRSRR